MAHVLAPAIGRVAVSAQLWFAKRWLQELTAKLAALHRVKSQLRCQARARQHLRWKLGWPLVFGAVVVALQQPELKTNYTSVHRTRVQRIYRVINLLLKTNDLSKEVRNRPAQRLA